MEQVYALHMRTIEGLVLAIDAKDHTTYHHLHRVRTYAVEIGKELGLDSRNWMLSEPRRCCTTLASWQCPITSLTSPAV